MSSHSTSDRYVLNFHRTSFVMELGEDGVTVVYHVVAFGEEGSDGILILLGNEHVSRCEIYHTPSELAPTLALGNTVVPLADRREAREVAEHLGLSMPTLPAGHVYEAGHA